MLTYDLKKSPGVPLYEALYRAIRGDILSGRLAAGQKLPSKRALSLHLEISIITVEGAYAQLLSEGYIRSVPRVGFFVEDVAHPMRPAPTVEPPAPEPPLLDLTANGCTGFPFSVWSKLQRQVMLDLGPQLLKPLPNKGLWELRVAISRQLADFRGLQADPENILIGAGTDFLYNLLIQLLGRDIPYAVEEPGYRKIRKIYAAAGVDCRCAVMDGQGVVPEALTDAQVLHISPSHHFPTGLVTPLSRRQALLEWARQSPQRYIIEDDYDSEFRFHAHPLPAMASMDGLEKVIYMNTFSKTLAPSIRISYMVLPASLMERFQSKLGFYSCTVPSFEQYTLSRFLEQGHFEKHLNRMRKTYRARRDRVIGILKQSPYAPYITILEQDAGLHFLVKTATGLSDEALIARCRALGIRVQALSEYYHGPVPESDRHCLVVNYSAQTETELDRLSQILNRQ